MKRAKKAGRNLLRRSILVSSLVATVAGGAFYTFQSGAPYSPLNAMLKTNNENAQVVWHPAYAMPWYNNGYRFLLGTVAPMVVGSSPLSAERYAALSTALVNDNIVQPSAIEATSLVSYQDLTMFHTEEYIQRVRRLAKSPLGLGMLNGENILSQGILDFFRASVEGTYTAALIALERGVGINLSGGFHHAFPDHEEGFCFFNDIAGSIIRLRHRGLVEKVLIIDLDAHHGNGNATYFRNDEETVIFDMYHGDIFPEVKVPVEFPIVLSHGETDESYLDKLLLLETVVSDFQPDLAFYLAGADPFEGDLLGGLSLTIDGLRKRDEFVLETVRNAGVPITVTLAGGYSALPSLVEINKNTVEVALMH